MMHTNLRTVIQPGSRERCVYLLVHLFRYRCQELCYQDEWALKGQGLHFVAEDDAISESPLISVACRDGGVGESADQDNNSATLANTVFVAAGHRRASSQQSSFSFNSNSVFSSHQSRYSS